MTPPQDTAKELEKELDKGIEKIFDEKIRSRWTMIDRIEEEKHWLKQALLAEREKVKRLEEPLKLAYRKHHLGDGRIAWNELGEKLMDALCESMGDIEFQEWLEKMGKEIDDGNFRLSQSQEGT